MRTRSGILILGVVLASIVLFSGYRARGFHYCGSISDRWRARIVNGPESCRPDEDPLDWRQLGWPARMKLAANMAVKAFGAN